MQQPMPAAGMICAQLDPSVTDPTSNRAKCLEAVRHAIADRGDIIVLPELATSCYMFELTAEARGLALATEDKLFVEIAELLNGTDSIVIVCFCELGPGETLWKSAEVISAAGVLTDYRKTHLWDRETLFFQLGSDPAPVIDTAPGQIGILICYDLESSEMPRTLAVNGAYLVVVPTNWPLGEHPDDERAAEIITRKRRRQRTAFLFSAAIARVPSAANDGLRAQ
ncbi:nitrilase-related carbon-nitrogen hydrolase [Glaciihabitans sp. UYNi722]|uniref:nitrilase-related carbon-nitrogen hydrolase n=1 Tax=Glaciihabitans sp. UYNi722 TaxID=3156344 RepID=UPI0033954EB2